MNTNDLSRAALYRRKERWSIGFAVVVGLTALLVLAGWQWGIDWLKRPQPGLAAMNPTTALCFLLSFLSFQCIGGPKFRRLGRMLSGLVLFIGLADMAGYLFPALSGIDGLLYRGRLQADLSGHVSNRMAANSAICFVLLSIAFLLEPAVGKRRRLWADLCILIIGLICLFSLLGYLHRVSEYYHWLRYAPMSVYSAVCFFLLGMAFLKQETEEDLGLYESRWKLLVGSVKDYAIFLVDPQGLVQSWNAGAAAIKGYTANEIIGRPISLFYSAEEAAEGVPARNLEMAARHGHFYSEGWRFRKDGSRFWAEIVLTPVYNERKELFGFAKITRDTTEQKMAREKIAYQARMIEDTSDAIFSTDTRFRITTWNKAAESLFGYMEEEVLGRPAAEVLRSQLNDTIRQAVIIELREKGYWHGQAYYENRKGERMSVLVSVSATHDAQGEREGYVMVCRDVTEWKKAEEQLRKFNEELEVQVREKTAAISQSNAELRDLASHLQNIREEERAAIAREVHDELGQQLTGLKMDLSMIQKKLRSGDVENVLDRVLQTTDLLDTTIRTVRRIATELRPSILDDLGLLAAMDWLAHEFERRSGIPTAFCLTGGEVETSPDISIGLFRICQESLTNVARHSGAGNVLIVLEKKGDLLILRITDDGKGMSLTGAAGGPKKTLGLLGMKERALMMGGKLEMISEPGKGMALIVTVPLIPTTEK